MTNTQTHKSLQLLRDGFMIELTEKIYSDERFTELMMDLTSEFVEQNIPIVDEDLKTDLSFLMMMESISAFVLIDLSVIYENQPRIYFPCRRENSINSFHQR